MAGAKKEKNQGTTDPNQDTLPGMEGTGGDETRAAGVNMGAEEGTIIILCPFCAGTGSIRSLVKEGDKAKCPGCDGEAMVRGVPVGPKAATKFRGVELRLFDIRAKGMDGNGNIAFVPLWKRGTINPRVTIA